MATMKKVEVAATLGEKFKIESKIRKHVLYVDQPEQAGGTDAGPTPLEYLFLALASCIGSVGRIVAHQKGITLRSMTVKVAGELDIDVLLGKGRDNRTGFTGIKAVADIDADLSQDEKKAFLKEVDSRCPVSDNLTNTTPVTIELAT